MKARKSDEMKKEYKIFLLPVIVLLLFLMSKADLKASSSEYLCWVYYCFFIILTISILISVTYFFIKKKYKFYQIVLIDFVIASVCGISILISSLFIGTNFQTANKNVIHEKKPFDFRPNNYVYEYKNIFIRGNKKIRCAGEICD